MREAIDSRIPAYVIMGGGAVLTVSGLSHPVFGTPTVLPVVHSIVLGVFYALLGYVWWWSCKQTERTRKHHEQVRELLEEVDTDD